MTRKRKALMISGIVIVIFVLGGYLFLQSSLLLNKLRGMLETRLTNGFGTDIKLGRLTGNPLYGLRIEDVTIADKNGPEKTIISVEELLIDYKVLKLLSKTLAIKKLTLQKPVINATVDEQGSINLAELIPTTTESEANTSLLLQAKEIELVDGHIYYNDRLRDISADISGVHLNLSGPFSPWNHEGKLAFRNATVKVNDIEKRIETFDADFHFTAESGQLERLRLEMENSWLQARADVNFKSPAEGAERILKVEVDGEIDLKDIAGLSPLTEPLAGVVRLNLSANGLWDAPRGHLKLTAPTVSLNDLTFDDVLLDADFTGDSVRLTQFSTDIAGGNLHARGEARVNKGEIDYETELSVASIQVQKLLPMLDKSTLLPPFDKGGTGEIFPLAGKIQGEMKLSMAGVSGKTGWKHLNAEGNFELQDGTFNGVKLAPSMVDYTIEDKRLTLTANIDTIQANINGQLGLTGKTALKMNLTPIDLSRLAKFAALDFEIKGTGELQAQISGNLTKPTMLTNLTVQDILMNGARLGDVTGQFLYSGDSVQVDELLLRNADTRCVLKGKIQLSDNPTVDLKVALEPLQIAEYTAFATPMDLTGQLFGEIALRGPAKALNGSGEIVAHDMQLFSLPVEMTAPLKLTDGIWRIPALTLKTPGGELNVDAKYNPPSGDYEFQLHSGNLNVGSILEVFGIEQIDGVGRITASGKGTIKKPEAKVHLSLTSVRYADVKIGDADYNCYFHEDKIKFNAVALADTFKLGGEITAIQPMPFNFTVQLENLDFGVLLEALPSSIYSLAVTDTPGGRIGGKTTGVFNLSGEIGNIMNSRGTIQLQSIVLRTPHHRFFNSEPISIAFANQTVEVEQFELFQQSEGNPSLYSTLVMRGRIGPEESDFIAQADEFDLSILKDIIGGVQPPSYLSVANLSGVGKFKLHLTGSYSNPEFFFDWDFPEVSLATSVHDTSISSIQLPAIDIPINSRGHISYRDKLLTLNQIQLALYANPLELKGVVPVDLTLFPVKSERSLQFLWQQRFYDSSMRLQLTAPNWDISVLNQFIADVEKIAGHANANIEVSGSPISPEVSGDILLEYVSLKSFAIEQPLEDLSATIHFNIDPMNKADAPWLVCDFDSLQWNIGRGRYSASGSVQYQRELLTTKEITSWFDADLLSAIKESIAKPEVELTLRGDDMDLGAFIDNFVNRGAVGASTLTFGGRASMLATVKGTGVRLQDYNAQVEIEPLDLVVGDYDLHSDEKIDVEFQNGQLRFDSITLKSRTAKPTAEISLSGSANLDGHFDLKMFTHQFNLNILSSFLKDAPPIDGLVSIQLDASGTAEKPEASALFEIQNLHIQNISPVVGEINLDSIEGSIALKDEILTVNTTSLKAYDNELTFYGTIPFGIRNSHEPMQLFIQGENIDLASFASLSPMVEEINGKIHLDMALLSNSSLQSAVNPFGFGVNPYLTGNLTMTDGRIKLTNLNPPIESLKLDLVAQHEPDKRESEIRLNELSFQLGEGRYKIAAAIKMDGLMPRQYNGTLDVDKFQLELIDSLLPEKVREPETISSSSEPEPRKRLSGYLSINAETKLNLSDLLNPSPTLKSEQRFWQLLGAATGSEVTLPEIRIQLGGYPIYNPQPITISLDEGSLSLPGCKLDYQSKAMAKPIFLRAYGRWNSDNQLAFEFRGFADTQMISEITPLSAFLAELTASNNLQQPISGLIEYRVSIRGNASNPQIKVSWPVADIELLGADVELLESEISFENGVFDIKEINLVTERTDIENVANINSILVKGRVPFNLSFMPYLLSPSDDELDLTISASVAKLDSLPFLAMQDAMIDGKTQIDIKVGGTIQAPKLSGDIALKDVVYQYENVSVTDTDVKLTLDNNNITIEQALGEFNNGSYRCSGKVGLSEYRLTDLNISGDWRDVEWEQEDLISLTCEGSVQLLGTFDKPRLEGNVTVKSGNFKQSWQSIVRNLLRRQPEGRDEVILDYPLVRDLELDLNIQIPQISPDYFWLDTIGTKIQPQVNGRVVGPINPISRLVFVGQVNILEGEFSYFNRKFLIKTGVIENGSAYVLDPNYKIDAEIATPIVGAKIPGAQEPKDVKITLNLTGTLQSPQPPVLEAEVIKPDSGEQYDFDQLKILELLTFGNIVRQEGAAVSFASETATDFIMRQAELFVGAQIADTFNLRKFQFDLGNQEGSLPQFLITKDISPQWAVTYMSTNSLSAKPSFLSIEYRINDNISIAGSRNEYSKYGVDLKYGIEW